MSSVEMVVNDYKSLLLFSQTFLANATQAKWLEESVKSVLPEANE